MSLILEALKKSEQQRRLGEAPTLGSPVLVARKRRSLLPVFAVAILVALAAGWWLSRTPATDEPGAPKPDSVAKAPAAAAPATHPAKPPAAQRVAPPAATRQPPATNATTATNAPPPATRSPAPAAAAPATTKAPVAAAPAAQTPPAAAPSARTPAPSAPAPAAAPPSTPAKPATNSVATTAPPAAHDAALAKSVDAKPATPNSTAAAAQPAKPVPPQPALPSVWDLPYATRKDLPELALTMHVFASEPSERFVVIKGERHAEGDELGDGLVLKEIRADGMVLEFKGQRFVYPRDGR